MEGFTMEDSNIYSGGFPRGKPQVKKESREKLKHLKNSWFLRSRPVLGQWKSVKQLGGETGDETEYLLITLWDSMEAVRRFAGPEPERAVYYPEDDRYFQEHERTPYLWHYEVRGVP
jgi:hypothetical protein